MTKLELIICEAENNGEIDLDTRDIMLGILNESTRYGKEALSIMKQIDALEVKRKKLKDIADRLNQEEKYDIADKSEQQLKKVEAKLMDLKIKLKQVDPSASFVHHGNDSASWETSLSSGKNGNKTLGKQLSMNNSRRDSEEDDRKPGLYKTTKGLKESVLEEIYEAELCGSY